MPSLYDRSAALAIAAWPPVTSKAGFDTFSHMKRAMVRGAGFDRAFK